VQPEREFMTLPSATPFVLGAYFGNPDNSNPSAEATFDSTYGSFTTLLGAAPQYLVAYVDQNKPISNWVDNAGFSASSFAQSPTAKTATPVIGLPMESLADTSISQDQYFRNFTSGQYDSVIQGVVQAWAKQGFGTQYWRPGWEMNLPGTPNYAGDDAQTQGDWVKAFQHVSTVLHAAGQADGVKVQVIWNPGTINYSNAEATTNLYPGNASVDVIGADIYADMYPYSLQNFGASAGTTAPSLAAWMADPANRTHYWSNPAATPYSSDGSGGHSLSLPDILRFAAQQGKPVALPETGAGNSGAGTDVKDDAAFPQWLAQQLSAAQAAGTKVDFVNIWDSNGGGNYQFTGAADGKPQEAAAWAQYFGAQAPAAAVVAPSPPAMTLGSGSDTLTVSLSEDRYLGDAQFTLTVDGKSVGGTQTVVASHAAGQTQSLTVLGSFGAGTHTVGVDFLNDAYAGTPTTDRNLYVAGASYDGVAASGATLALFSAGTQSLTVGTPLPAPITVGSGSDTLSVSLSEDRYLGDAQFTLTVDGKSVGGTQTVVASRAAGQTQSFTVLGSFGAGTHTVGVDFLNDAYAGTPITDRNLYVTGASYDGMSAGATLSLMSTGTQTMTVGTPLPAPITVGSGSDTLSVSLSEDRYLGDAQFTLTVDGKSVGGTQTVVASHAAGQTQSLTVLGSFGAGTHTVGVDFLNDAYAGTPTTDRNLYVAGASYDGVAASGATLSLYSAGTQTLTVGTPVNVYSPGSAGGTVTAAGSGIVNVGTGAVTVHAAGAAVTVNGGAGSLSFIGGSGTDSVIAGSGAVLLTGNADTLTFTAGSGSASIVAGSGHEVYDLVHGAAGGTISISNFNASLDTLHLQGYPSAAVMSTQTAAGSTNVVLTDDTRLTLVGVVVPSGQSVFS